MLPAPGQGPSLAPALYIELAGELHCLVNDMSSHLSCNSISGATELLIIRWVCDSGPDLEKMKKASYTATFVATGGDKEVAAVPSW